MTLTARSVIMLGAGIIPVLAWPSLETVRWWVLAWLLVVLLDGLLCLSPRRLEVERVEGQLQVRLTDSSTTSLLVSNPTKRRTRLLVRDAWQPSAGADNPVHRLRLPAGERRELRTTLTPTRRGNRHTHRLTVRVWGPLGLTCRQSSREVPGLLRVLPPFHSRRHLPSRLARLREIDGRAAVRTRGQGTEFDSLRDYVEGDDVRSIDWRATARRQNVVVRTWQPERDRRVVIVLDTSRTSAARIQDEPRLDAAMEAALLLTALAGRAGDRVDVLAGDRVVRSRVTSGTGKSQVLGRLVTALTPLEPALLEADWTALASAIMGTSRRRSLVVLLTSLDPAAVEDGLVPALPMLTTHHHVVVASVADPGLREWQRDLSCAEEVYRAAAATKTEAQRRHSAQGLGQLGVTVLEESPAALAPALADHYLLLKSRGLL